MLADKRDGGRAVPHLRRSLPKVDDEVAVLVLMLQNMQPLKATTLSFLRGSLCESDRFATSATTR